MDTYTRNTIGWEDFSQPDAVNQRKTNNSLARYSLSVSITFTHFIAACSFLIFRWQLTVVPFFFGSCLVLHPISVNQPGPESKVLSGWQISAALSLSIKHFVVPAGEHAAFADAAVSFIPLSSFVNHNSISPDCDHKQTWFAITNNRESVGITKKYKHLVWHTSPD